MFLDMLEEDPAFEDDYFDWLEENCKCNIEEDGCSCLSFDEWLSMVLLEQEQTNCDF